jgi:hypothetical protein
MVSTLVANQAEFRYSQNALGILIRTVAQLGTAGVITPGSLWGWCQAQHYRINSSEPDKGGWKESPNSRREEALPVSGYRHPAIGR